MRNEIADIPLPQRSPEHTVKIALQTRSGIREAWLQVFVPRFNDDTPFIRIRAAEHQIWLEDWALWTKFESAGSKDGQSNLRVKVENFFWRLRQSRGAGPGKFELDLWAIPLDLTITREFGASQNSPANECFLSLTQNERAKPWTIFVRDRDGSRIIDRKDAKTLMLSDSCSIKLDEHFDWRVEGDETCRPRLVGEVVGAANALEPFPIDKPLEDAILLLSFFTATRTMVTRISVLENGTLTERYFARFGDPERPSRLPFGEGLVHDKEIEERFRDAWITWSALERRESLRLAIHALVPGNTQVIPLEFLRLFAAVEGLVKAFPGTVVPATDLVRQTKHCVALSKLSDSLRDRGICEDELKPLADAIENAGRLTFRQHFERFCNHWRVDTDDLWPMFAPQSAGLYYLRNRVVHGSDLSLDVQKAISVASSHLVFLLARCLLRILRSSVDGTYVHYPQGGHEDTMLAGLETAMDVVRRSK